MLPGSMSKEMFENTALPGVKDLQRAEMLMAAEAGASAAGVIEVKARFTHSPRNLENSVAPMVPYMTRTMS